MYAKLNLGNESVPEVQWLAERIRARGAFYSHTLRPHEWTKGGPGGAVEGKKITPTGYFQLLTHRLAALG